jgi:protein phosphatase
MPTPISTTVIRASGVTNRGRVRPTNEDCFGIDPALQLLVVADGMGGHAAGEVAARIAVESVLDYVGSCRVTTTWPYGYDRTRTTQANLLRTAVQVANTRVHETAAASASCAGMGTTIVAALVEEDLLTVAHVGDSRVYMLRRGRLEQLTNDDSWAAVMMARDPSIDPAVIRAHPMRNALTSVIGSRPAVDVHVTERVLEVDDLVVLTTDGVHGVLSDGVLMRLCEATLDPHEIANRLIEEAMAVGSRDNCTAVVGRYGPQK